MLHWNFYGPFMAPKTFHISMLWWCLNTWGILTFCFRGKFSRFFHLVRCACVACVCAVFVWKSHLRHSMTEINAPKCIPLFGCLEMATSDFYGILNKYSYIFGFLLINSIVSSGSENTWQDNRIGLLAFCMRHTITMNSNTLYMDVQNVWR